MPMAKRKRRPRRPRNPRSSGEGIILSIDELEDRLGIVSNADGDIIENIEDVDVDADEDEDMDIDIDENIENNEGSYFESLNDNEGGKGSAISLPLPLADFLANKEVKMALGAVGALAVGWLVYKALSKSNPSKPPIIEDPNKLIIIDAWGGGSGAGQDEAGKADNCWLGTPLWLTGARANLEIAKSVGNYLSRAGLPIVYTREGEQVYPLPERVGDILKSQGVVLVTIRHSGFASNCPKGATIIYPSQPSAVSIKSKRLAYLIGENLQFDYSLRRSARRNTVRRIATDVEYYDGKKTEELFSNLKQYSQDHMPISVIVDPSALCDCEWQEAYLVSLRHGKNADDAYVNRIGAGIANAVWQYLSQSAM